MAGKEYQLAFSIGARLQSQFGGTFKTAQSSVAALQVKIESLNKKQGDINAYLRQQAAVDKTRSRLELLQKQYANVKEAMEKTGDGSVDLMNKELRLRQQIEEKTESLGSSEQKLNRMGDALSSAGINTSNLGQESQKLSSEIGALKEKQEQVAQASDEMGQSMADSANAMAELVAAAGAMKVLQIGYNAMRECAAASIEFETSMAAVKRTVGGSDSFLGDLGNSFKELSTEIPISTGELAQIATTAGQLGIAQDKVQSFTTVMAELATTTDLSADSAATMLAQFANITGVTDYERLGSVVAELGDATATTASKVVEMSQGMAAAASQAGMSSTDIMAISAAVGSLGIESASGSTSMSTLISSLNKAVETGDGLVEFASVANMTAEQFRQAWGENAAGALDSFIQGLNDTERNGKSAIVILDELGINNVRQTKAILGLASAGGLLSNTIAQANNAWNQNTALAAKAGVMYSTTEAKLTMLSNAANNTKIAIGDALTPAIGGFAEAGTAMLRPVNEFIQKNPGLVRAVTAAAGVLAAATLGVTAYAGVVRAAAKAHALFTATIPGLNVIMGVAAGLAAVTAIAIGLSEAFKAGQESMEELDSEFDNLNADFKKQSNIRSLCAEYQNLQNELTNTSNAANQLSDLDKDIISIQVTAKVAEGFAMLGADDFVDGTIIPITGEADRKNLLEAVKFLKDGENGAWITLNASKGEQISSKELINDLINNEAVIKVSGEARKSLEAEGFLKEGKDTISLKALPEQFLSTKFISDAAANGEVQIELTPEVANTLDQYQLLKDSTVQLSAKAQAQMVEADEFMINHNVSLKGSAVEKLYAQGFLQGTDFVYLKGTVNHQADQLSAADFFSGEAEIALDAKRGENLLTAKDLFSGDAVIHLDGQAKEKVEAAGFLVDKNNTVPLKGDVAEWMLTTEFFSNAENGIVSVPLTPGVASTLDQNNLLQGSTVLLNANAGADKLSPDMLMSGKTVLLAAGVSEDGTKTAHDFLSGENVVILKGDVAEDGTITAAQLVPESERKILLSAMPDGDSSLTADSFITGEKVVGIAGIPSGEITTADYIPETQRSIAITATKDNTLTADSFIAGEKTVSIKGTPVGAITVDDYISANNRIVELTANVTNLADVQQAISSLKTEADTLKDKAATAKTDLTAAQAALSDMEERQGELQARLTHAGTSAAKSEIQAAIEAQNQAVEEQRGKVEELEMAYSSAVTQYALTQAAADELAAKEQRLSEIKTALAEQTNGVVSAIEKETSAINEQMAQADKMAAAEQARLRSEIYGNASRQARQFTEALKESNSITASSSGTFDTWNRSLKYAGMTAEEVTVAYQSMLQAFDEQASSPDFVPFSDEARESAAEIQLLASLMGTFFSDLQQYADGSVSFSDAFGWVTTNDNTLLDNMGDLNEQVAEYGEQLKALKAVQDAFIENLSSGVASGALTAEEAMGLLTTSMSAAGADAEAIVQAVALLNADLGDVPAATAEAAASAAELTAAMQPVLDKMTALGEAYQAAYDEAYKSMDGQFKLFEEAPQLTQESVDRMIQALESQAEYMQQYSWNLQEAGKMGLSEGLLAQLSDGSKESAAYLAAIVSDGANKIDELNVAFAAVEEGKETFAGTVAEMQTNFDAEMAKLQQTLETTVAEMDLSSDAASAGAATVQAFADAAKDKTGAVAAAFAKVASAAKAALNITGGIGGYASGTENAERGFKMVGERGPELVFFNGGEKVMNAQETAAFQRNRTIEAEPVNALPAAGAGPVPHIEVKPVYNLSGGMNTDEVRAILDEHTAGIKDMVADAIEEIDIDRKRSMYS